MPWDDLHGEIADLFRQDQHVFAALESWAGARRKKLRAYQSAYIARMPIEQRRAMWRERYHRQRKRLGVKRRKVKSSDPRLEAKRRRNREHMQRKRAEQRRQHEGMQVLRG